MEKDPVQNTIDQGKDEKKKLKEAKEREKLQKYETSVRKRVECEERAFHIVNKLIYGSVDPQYLIECGNLISKDNYSDIVEERGISFLCGYPVCDQELKNVPKQKYHISTRSNKVYDITERKNFCSNQCLKASKVFQMQISESPVWARENEPRTEFTLLPHKSVKGMVGTEVVGQAPWKPLQNEMESLNELDHKLSSSEKEKQLKDKTKRDKVDSNESHSQTIMSSKSAIVNSETTDKVISDFERLNMSQISENIDSSSTIHETQDFASRLNENMTKLTSDELENQCSMKKSQGEKAHNKSISQLDRLNKLLSKNKKILSGMIDIQDTTISCSKSSQSASKSANSVFERDRLEKTEITSGSEDLPSTSTSSTAMKNSDQSEFVHIEKQRLQNQLSPLQLICQILRPWVTEDTKNYLKASEFKEKESINACSFYYSHIQSGYKDLCKRLDFQEKNLQDALNEYSIEKAQISKREVLPDYQKLKEESEQFQLKVTEFVTGRKVRDKSSKEEKNKDDDNPVFLPTVDIYDQTQIRAKIVLERLDKSIPELLVPMGLTVQEISTHLRELVYSFRLERDNIVFKPSQWTLIALILLRMLSLKVKTIDAGFRKDPALSYFNILLSGIGHSFQDIAIQVDNLLH